MTNVKALLELVQKSVDHIVDRLAEDIEGLHRRIDGLNEEFF